jgi:hypothetical protein
MIESDGIAKKEKKISELSSFANKITNLDHFDLYLIN